MPSLHCRAIRSLRLSIIRRTIAWSFLGIAQQIRHIPVRNQLRWILHIEHIILRVTFNMIERMRRDGSNLRYLAELPIVSRRQHPSLRSCSSCPSESGVMLSCFVSARNVLMREVSVEISMTLIFGQRYGQEMMAEKTV